MWDILNCEPLDYSEEAVSILRQVSRLHELTPSREQLLGIIGGFDGLILRLGHRVDKELLARGPRLRFIATPTTGLNHVDVVEAQRRGVSVISLRGETEFLEDVSATAEHTWGLLLALIRHIPAAHADVCAGRWCRNKFRGRELREKCLGVVGLGRLGRKVARIGLAFGMRVMACDLDPNRHEEQVNICHLDELLDRADIVSIHASYTEQNRNLIDAAALAKMKPGSILINTSRGELVDEHALLASLQTGRLAGCAVDVLSGENSGVDGWPESDPLVEYARTHDNLLLTPHLGGATFDSMAQTEVFIARKIVRFLANQAPFPKPN